jgi:hypothetical protein
VIERRQTVPPRRPGSNPTRIGVGSRSPITNHHSPTTAILIDTPAIRIASNSRLLNAPGISNRHSSAPCRLHNFSAFQIMAAALTPRAAFPIIADSLKPLTSRIVQIRGKEPRV